MNFQYAAQTKQHLNELAVDIIRTRISGGVSLFMQTI